jgi:transposase
LALVAKRHRDLGRHKTKQSGRLHALLAELVPGGLVGKATVTSANRFLDNYEPMTAVDECRVEIARDYIGDLATLETQVRASKRRVEVAVDATGTTLRDLVGIGPIGAATILGAIDIARFETRDRFAAYNGTAPIQASSASKTRVRLNTGGNRHINHVLHIAAVNQLRQRGPGRIYFDRKVAEGKSSKEAIRALKRRISDAVWRQLRAETQTR